MVQTFLSHYELPVYNKSKPGLVALIYNQKKLTNVFVNNQFEKFDQWYKWSSLKKKGVLYNAFPIFIESLQEEKQKTITFHQHD